MAAGHSLDPARWQEAFECLMGRIAGRFKRVEPRRRVRRLVLGLLSDLPRKNCWTIAEWAGESTPNGMQHLLGRAKWDADAVGDDVRGYVVEHLHDDQAVPVVDESGDVKKGTGTVGVQRQYTGTAGRIENTQVAVYLIYAGQRGHAAVDRELYVPRSWTSDPERCRTAGLAGETAFATKPELTELVRVAGSRLRVEEFFQSGKGLAGLDEHQVRRYASWLRWVTLAMLAHAFRTVVRRTNTSAALHRTASRRSPVTRSSACSSPSSSSPSTPLPTDSPGPPGDAAARPDPRPATTSDKTPKHEDHDRQLEY
ncbi:hypothetical protein GCM10010530_38930 [Kribbella aluminosa]